jgi:plastocyanin
MNNEHEYENQNSKPILQRHRKSRLLVAGGLFTVGAIVFAALALGGGKSTGGNNMAGMSMTPVAASDTPVATNTVSIKNFGFSPATISVTAGSTVEWTNKDSVQHDVTFAGGSIVSTVLNHNDTFSHTFLTPGTYHYICSIHPFMHGTVIVTGSGGQHAAQPTASTASGY